MSPTRTFGSAVALSVLALAATACDKEEAKRLGLPEPITEQGDRVLTLWQGSWIAAFAVGGVVWGLIIWAVLFHRKRSGELPPQVRYNLPIEILYTVVPVIIVAVLFYFTARDETYLEKTSPASAIASGEVLVVDVTGYQWSWRFAYPQHKGADGQPVTIYGVPVDPNKDTPGKPVLHVPTGQKVRFNLRSADVIHSFWVPAMIYKKDVIPGEYNKFEQTFTRTGTYQGRCAELCGVDHSRMLFAVKVDTPQEFTKYINEKKAPGSTQ